MPKSIKVLLVEDSENDALLLLRELRRGGYDPIYCRVESAEEMNSALQEDGWELIICDYTLPHFSAPHALNLIQNQKIDLPFIIVSGNIGEENAVAAMKAGAHDYIMKDNLARLVPVIEREVHEAQIRRERKRINEALKDSEERFRSMVEHSHEGIVIINEKFKLIYVNNVFSKMIGLNPVELIQKDFRTFFADDSFDLAGQFIDPDEKSPLSSRSAECDMNRSTTPCQRVLINFSLIKDTKGTKFIVAQVLDITERYRSEIELRKSEEKYRLVVENASEAIFIEQDGKIKFSNPKTLEICGYTKNELQQISWSSLKVAQDFLDGTTSNSAYRIQTRQKLEKWIDVNQVNIEYDNQSAVLNFVRDITEQKLLEDRLKMSQKLEAIGTLAGGIAHDFNNILSPILGYTELVMEGMPKNSHDYNNLVQVYQAANRAKDLVQQILTFSRQSEQEPRSVQIQLIVHEALKLLRAAIPSTIKFKINIDSNCAPVNADPTQIHQIVMNLCTNAYHAMMTKGGVLGISLDEIYINKEDAVDYKGINSGPFICLSVSDTGHGMDANVLPRIFEPFFTTKEKGLGTGMGLAVVHGIVKNHKGHIDVYSEVGKGSTFKVYLPIEPQPIASAEQIHLDEIPRGSERILVIDDESYIVQMLVQMLESLGYTVEARTNSNEALELFLLDPYYFQLVITDQIMPQITGDVLARKLLAIRKDIPIILCTGFSEFIEKDALQDIGIRDLVMKPVLKSELARVIRKNLDTCEE
jgi:two-component system cell cycle sensor histidine kinase/response regulator CckA